MAGLPRLQAPGANEASSENEIQPQMVSHATCICVNASQPIAVNLGPQNVFASQAN